MPDREKVANGLTELKRFLPSTMWGSVNDALALLKEQEAEMERLKKPTAGSNKIPLKW